MGRGGWSLLRDIGVKLMPSPVSGCMVANNQYSCVLGSVNVPIKLEGKVVVLNILIMPELSHAIVLGMDFWLAMGIVPDLRGSSWTFGRSCPELCSVASVISQDVLTEAQRRCLEELTTKYSKLFTERLGCTDLVEHQIVTEAEPIRLRPYRYSPVVQENIDKEIDQMLKDDIIEPSDSAWSFPVLLVPKPNGKWRFCVDYRQLNRVTKKDAYPIPFMASILDKLRNARYLSSLDIKSAYWQVRVGKDSREKTAFTVPGRGLYQFKKMPFGLTNAPATWQRLADRLLGAKMEPNAFVYLDDIIVVSDTFEKHLELLGNIFERLLSAGLTLSEDKCQFCRPELRYLGYVVDRQGLHVDPEKVAAVLNIPTPKNATEVRRLVGMASWYRRFVANFSTTIAPLTALLGKHKKWHWSEECEKSFRTIKNALASAPVLTCPDFTRPFMVQTDASAYGIGAVLSQEHDDGEHVICYISRSLSRVERNYSTTERELLAIIFACEKLRPYLEGYHFKVITDHHSLVWLHNLREPTGRLARWVMRLQQFDFEVIHRKGKDHIIPDVLSRSVPEVAEVDPQIQRGQDRWYDGLRERVRDDPLHFPQWRYQNNTLYKYVTCSYPTLREEHEFWKEVLPKYRRREILQANHDDALAGHGGIYKTYERVKRKYYWPKMRADVARYVRNCPVCLANKAVLQPPAGVMGQLPRPERPWEAVSIDLFGPLPRSVHGYRFVLVVLDTFSKFPLFFPIRTATASMVSKIIEEHIFLFFGCPRYVVCDNGVQFRSHLFTGLCERYGIKIIFTPAYHPQANPVERVNSVLKTMLRCYIEDNHRNWAQLLPKVGCAIRSSVHEATGLTPYFINFSREYVSSGDQHELPDFADEPPQDSLLRSRELAKVFKDVQKRLQRAHQRSKQRYDLRRRPLNLRVGQTVYRKNHVLSDATRDFTAKLAPKYVGPFTVKRKLSPLLYELVDEQNRPKGTWHIKDLKAKPPDPETDSESEN